ncbi:hypothetical protein FGE12_27505 [Aggregicoccus sp. 17bor-14]|uniref:hypothetical protein n=1 Tax=Myxococcaceae TaxID=31 RepID=UPI00129CB6B1|nr:MULTISPECIES: hypothetical protein [Myxococcaceae]MBF5046194.1 hypothetical protein [Simulacricoccus sp. 17bor-14]MRI91919.1 hypothetical protein [Aggregicoccus sp. 17bor-14]
MRRLPLVLAAALTLALLPRALAQKTAAPSGPAPCVLEYQRADTMWAAIGRPDGALGTETISLQPGQTKVFVTDWKYEKKRNDGTNYYGSHLRLATSRGPGAVRIVVVGNPISEVQGAVMQALGGPNKGQATLQPGVQAQFRHDLQEVSCP